jgi:hypothetical protein
MTTIAKGGSINLPTRYLLSRDNIAMAQTLIRQKSVAQTHQSVGVGHPFVTTRKTKGTQSKNVSEVLGFNIFQN